MTLNTITTNMLSTENIYKNLLDSIFDAVLSIDLSEKIVYWNSSATRLTGYSCNDVIGQNYKNSYFLGQEESGYAQGIEMVMRTGMPGSWKGYIYRKNGQRIPIESKISPVFDQNKQIIGIIEVFRDISAHIALEQAHKQTLQTSRKDLLTGLYNRAATAEILKAEIERASRYQQPISLIMADIDYFKSINDDFGHDAGDKVLASVAAVLTHNLRSPDIAGRWGGEEFLIITPNSSEEQAGQLAQRLKDYIANIPENIIPRNITASFGIAQLENNQNNDKLIYQADMALYQAKNTGRNKIFLASKNK